jgi:sigma-E factor negative regulatory protein RseC
MEQYKNNFKEFDKMKTEQGLVIEVIDNVTKIRVGRHNDCSNCGACPGNDSLIISANNKIGAKPGQRVVFEVEEVNVLRAAFVVFILPLIAAFIGVLLGGFIGKSIGTNVRISQIAGGIVIFLLSLIFVKLFDKSTTASKESQPEIIRIL